MLTTPCLSADAFSRLAQQILELSTTFFTTNYMPPPLEKLYSLPPKLPYFLEDTPSANHLRAAFVCHSISSIITLRIFTPFCFGLDGEERHLNSIFSTMSRQLRAKSTRKEALWRQQTLNAAFTTADAKKKINSAAQEVIEEIISSIKDFSNPQDADAIRTGLRRIVKLAVETWRYARLERELITARLPPADEDSKEEASKGLWLAPTFDPVTGSFRAPVPISKTEVGDRRIILRLLPLIQREPIHEALRFSDKMKDDKGSVYNTGLALYDNSVLILARKQELRMVGNVPQPSPKLVDFPRAATLQRTQTSSSYSFAPPRTTSPLTLISHGNDSLIDCGASTGGEVPPSHTARSQSQDSMSGTTIARPPLHRYDSRIGERNRSKTSLHREITTSSSSNSIGRSREPLSRRVSRNEVNDTRDGRSISNKSYDDNEVSSNGRDNSISSRSTDRSGVKLDGWVRSWEAGNSEVGVTE